jgi:hypothetical protein
MGSWRVGEDREEARRRPGVSEESISSFESRSKNQTQLDE